MSKQIKTEYIDPDKKPSWRSKATCSSGTLIFSYKGRSERTTANTEQDVTNTIIKVVSGKVRKVYFTQGHGEHDPNSGERDGYQAINTNLTNENYGVEKLVLAQTSKVPDDASGGYRRRPQDRLLRAGDRRAQEMPREQRQAAADARPAVEARAPSRC